MSLPEILLDSAGWAPGLGNLLKKKGSEIDFSGKNLDRLLDRSFSGAKFQTEKQKRV